MVPKKLQDIEIPAEDVLFLEKVLEGKASPKKASPVSLQFGGATLKVWKKNMTFVDSVKVLAVEYYNACERVFKDPTPVEVDHPCC